MTSKDGPVQIDVKHAIAAVQIIQCIASEAIKQDANVLQLGAPVVKQIVDLNNAMIAGGSND